MCDKDSNVCAECKADADCKLYNKRYKRYCDVPNRRCFACRSDAGECLLPHEKRDSALDDRQLDLSLSLSIYLTLHMHQTAHWVMIPAWRTDFATAFVEEAAQAHRWQL